MLAGEPVHRLELSPLSRAAVGGSRRGHGRDAGAVHALTRGNPFFVAEALAAPPDEVPANVKDAVLARVRLLSPECREALERLSVIPSTIPTDLAAALGALDAAGGGRAGGAGRAARGGRARVPARARAAGDRAVACRRCGGGCSTRAVVAALRARGRAGPRPAAAPRGRGGRRRDAAGRGPGGGARGRAGRARTGRRWRTSRRCVPHADRLPLRERAAFLDDYGWELYNAHRFGAAVDAVARGRAALPRARRAGAAGAVPGPALAAPVHGRRRPTRPRRRRSARCVTLLRRRRRGRARLRDALPGRDPRADAGPRRRGEVLERADALALRSQRPDLAALCLNYLAIVRVEAGEPDGLQTMRNSIALAQAGAHHEVTARGYCNLAELLLRVGRLDELERCVARGAGRSRASAGSGRTPTTSRCIAACCCCAAATGRPPRPGCAGCSTPTPTRGCCSPTARRGSGRLLARRGDRVGRRAARRGVGAGAASAAAARAGLRGDRARRVGVADRRSRTPRGRSRRCCCRGPSTRARRRSAASCCAICGDGAARAAAGRARSSGCPPRPCGRRACAATGARRRRRGGARRRSLRDRARAGRSGDAEACAEALHHARAPRRADRGRRCVRDRLRELGASVPRGPRPATRANPAGLDRPPARRARAPARRPYQRRDRRPPGPLGPHRRPPRRRDPRQARRLLPPRSRRRI